MIDCLSDDEKIFLLSVLSRNLVGKVENCWFDWFKLRYSVCSLFFSGIPRSFSFNFEEKVSMFGVEQDKSGECLVVVWN